MSRHVATGSMMILLTSAWALVLFVFMVAGIAAAVATTAHPDLIRAIRCPVCDYTTSSMVKTVLTGHRLCAVNGGKSTDEIDCEQIKEWTGWEESELPPLAKTYQYPTKQFGASPEWVKKQVLPSACSYHVFKAFPVGTSSPQSQQLAPGEEEEEALDADGKPEYKSFEEREKARRLKIQEEYKKMKDTPREPVDENYRAAIKEACEMDFGSTIAKERRERMGHWLYNETMNAIFDDEVMNPNMGVNEVFAKRRDYRRVLKMQRYYCGKACGTINRPDGDEGPDRDIERGVLSWNADGEYISRNHIP